jgi:hypothetical protein
VEEKPQINVLLGFPRKFVQKKIRKRRKLRTAKGI